MDLNQSTWGILWNLLCATALGGFVGLDRELRHKPAGLRTHMMVGLGAAAFTSTAVGYGGSDAARLITGVATGIGFLGAGAIMKSGAEIEGITTAASIWVVGAIGAACGVGAYALATATAALASLILVIVGRIEYRLRHKHEHHNVTEGSAPPST